MKAFKIVFKLIVIAIWLTLGYAVVDRIGQEIEFQKSMGVMK